MSIYVRDADNVSHPIKAIVIRNALNTPVAVKEIQVRDAAGNPHIVWQNFAAAAAADVYGTGNSNSPITITTNVTDITVSGGIGPYTYSWAPPAGWSAVQPTYKNTAFRKPSVANGASFSGTAVLTVTDANGDTATAPVGVSVENFGGFE